MRFKSFEIFNYKGIERAKIDLSPSGANVATLIGLNESGKTTLLEAISRFSRSNEEQALYDSTNETIEPSSFVPKSRKSNFTGDVRIAAVVMFSPGEKEKVLDLFEKRSGAKVDKDSIPDEFSIYRTYSFVNSDYKSFSGTWNIWPRVKPKGAKKFKLVTSSEMKTEWEVFISVVNPLIPQVVYFPTFLFSQPERVILNPGKNEGAINKLYRQIIDNVALSLPHPLNIKSHIVDRIITPESIGQQILSFWGLATDKQEQVNAALSELSAHLTDTVFQTWSRIFGGQFSGREIVLRLGIDNSTPSTPLVYLQFSLKDGTAQYDIGERSLGFRWFFSFLLFTLYRVSAKSSASTLFLLDEPASNLHSRAQLQLINSFPKIATGDNQIIYSTHSHYMINPDWLDQAFIVSNGAVDYDDVNEDKSS